MTKPEREKWQKEKEQREGRTHRSGVGRKKIAHDIRVTGHDTLPSKAIRAISIGHLREMWRVNKLTNSRLLSLQFSTIRNHDKKGKEKEEKKKRLSIYLSSMGRHEMGDVELLIVQPFKEPLSVGNTTPPWIVLNINHGVWGKYELRRIHQNLWVIPTHQLTPHPLCQVECPQAYSFKGSGNLQSNNGGSFQVWRSKKGLDGRPMKSS